MVTNSHWLFLSGKCQHDATYLFNCTSLYSKSRQRIYPQWVCHDRCSSWDYHVVWATPMQNLLDRLSFVKNIVGENTIKTLVVVIL